MSLMLAQYNDSMRLGMGFNSYTQTMCIDKAVKVTNQRTVRADNPSQVVTYSSKCVSRLSDIVKSMNVSYCSSIKTGTVEIAGSSNTINEDKIKDSDTNAVVSVKVVNQTTIVDEDVQFQPPKSKGILPGSQAFNDAFGDCYISGFIEGGDFNGIISLKVIDRTKTDQIVSKIKRGIGSSNVKEFSLEVDSFSQGFNDSDVENETESTISVSWMGGGQVKDPLLPWDMNSVYAAAAAFPDRVAKCPQKTWAILTKYKANRSFIDWTNEVSFTPLEYDSIASYTAELFDSYMEYKQLLKVVEDIISNPKKYSQQTWKENSIPVVTSTLVAVKAALRIEMSKIVQAVDILARDPGVLKRTVTMDAEPADELIRNIVGKATMGISWQAPTPPKKIAAPQEASSTAKSDTPAPVDAPVAPNPVGSFNPKAMIAPEVWSDLIPTLNTGEAAADRALPSSTMPASLVGNFPPPPPSEKEDLERAAAKQQPPPPDTLNILSAVCGIFDVTDSIKALVKPDQTLSFRASEVKGMIDAHSRDYDKDLGLYLTIVYSYGKELARLCIAKHETSQGSSDTTQTYTITPASTQYASLRPTDWNADTWAISAIVYGGKQYTDGNYVTKVLDQLKANYNAGQGSRTFKFTNETLGDPWAGVLKSGLIFYQVTTGGTMHCAVGLESRTSCIMTDRLLNDVVDPSLKVAPPPPSPTTPYLSMAPGAYPFKCTLNGDGASRLFFGADRCWIKKGSTEPFLKFANGTSFYYGPNGNFYVQQGGVTKFQTANGNDSYIGTNLELKFQCDDKICLYTNGYCYCACDYPERMGGNRRTILALSDFAPFVDMGMLDGDNWRSVWADGNER